VESVLGEFPGVHEVAVAGVPAALQGEEIAAFVVAAEGVTEAALLAHCRNRLSHDKRPRIFVFVQQLPRNTNGKVLRTELRNLVKGSVAQPN
jgi:acyl-coenzyme A synthetase/AMP-(fatty) acid ligase